MDAQEIKIGMRVRTDDILGSTKGMIIAPEYITARRPRIGGKVLGWVPGHGGDVWWVQQDNGYTGAYCFNEFEPVVTE